ncbi:zinc carboxypeptidase [Nitzschia inconspicua]|uniref:Zinc carboxypeptidase n=1 Tax=Nitzschia inconspicua TaxID=303405 RepID=A0A9K3K8Z9_9STRA|nr:zinc carboxypeptidase [Nitzschia inconspicua]KAG7371608.1 zinc carboxypeptidase [Nitzschia inconspicua]
MTKETEFCHIHVLVQTPNEYQQLVSLLQIPSQTKHPNNSYTFRYNQSLSQEWIEPRLQIQRYHQSKNNNTTQSQRTVLQNDEGYYSHIVTRECFLDCQGMLNFIQDFIQQATDTGLLHVEWVDIGDSYLKNIDPEQGYDINVLTITGINSNNNNINNSSSFMMAAAPFVLTSSIHAREYASPELVRRFLLHILDYPKRPNHGDDINMNPDWNAASSLCSNDAWGVDLNRNYPFQWGMDDGSSVDACSPFARGSKPASEPETQAVIDYAYTVFPLNQRQQSFSVQTENIPQDLPDDWKGYNE